jgi:beta-galactosidase
MPATLPATASLMMLNALIHGSLPSFGAVWYSQYGAKPGDADLYDRRTWKIIAHGGNGYNYYMVHGGSNFGYTNNDEDAASYDYGAAIGQAGDLRPIYYTFKRAAWFSRSFQDVLENSDNGCRLQQHSFGYRL